MLVLFRGIIDRFRFWRAIVRQVVNRSAYDGTNGNGSTRPSFRGDIQGLRAIAVMLVLIYHLAPNLVPGGFVGVDVFFVISGFLITSHLVREMETSGEIRFSRFYARRLRRLLPASVLVQVATAFACLYFLPPIRWGEMASQMLASVFQVQNFYLYFEAIDYLNANKSASPFQHFWSLSIEEQFYAFWPILILVGGWVGHRAGLSTRNVAAVTIFAICILSLIRSVEITNSDPGAYFLTTVRLYELGIGGLTALLLPRVKLSSASAGILGAIGLAWILVAGFAFSSSTVFPGYAALLPTLGTALVIIAGSTHQPLVNRLIGIKPARYVGNISYALYLWHWPLVVFAMGNSENGAVSFSVGLLIFSASILFAHITTYHFESRFRPVAEGKFAFSKFFIAFLSFPALAAFALTASAFTAGSVDSSELSFRPSIERARLDVPDLQNDGCHLSIAEVEPRPCFYGSDESSFTVMLVGDSHAAQWLPAVQELSEQRHWRVITNTKQSCPFANVLVQVASKAYPECQEWGARVLKQILKEKPSLVITAQVANTRAFGAADHAGSAPDIARGYVDNFREIAAAHIPIAAISTTPLFPKGIPECLSENRNDQMACAMPRSSVVRSPDPILEASALVNGVQYVDLLDDVCPSRNCVPVISDILVYRDVHHLTATFVRSLAGKLGEGLDEALNYRISTIPPKIGK